MSFFRMLLSVGVAAPLLLPATAMATPSGKHVPRIVVYPDYPTQPRKGPYGFLPGYRAPLPLGEWRDRAPRYGGGDFSRSPRFWSGGEWRYGWGGPGFYRGRYNGGGFGPCWSNTPIGPMWNCGM